MIFPIYPFCPLSHEGRPHVCALIGRPAANIFRPLDGDLGFRRP